MKTSFSPLAYESNDTHLQLLTLKQIGSAENFDTPVKMADD